MSELEAYLYQRVEQEIRSWAGHDLHDAYIIALYVGFVDDDMRQGMLSGPCYNTLKHWQQKNGAKVGKWETSEHLYCTKWTLCEPVVEDWGNGDTADPLGVDLRNKYLADQSLFITDEENSRFWDHLFRKKGRSSRPGSPGFTPEDSEEYDQFQEKLTRNGEAFVDVCAATVQRLHESGAIREVFGHSVPVILDFSNDMDYLKVRAWRLMRQSNPDGIAEEWINLHLTNYGLKD